jgi:hypothetical protein
MPSLEKTLRTQLERVVKDARDVAEAGSRSALEQLGVGDSNRPPHLSEAERELRRKLRIHGRQLGDARDEKRGTQQIDRLIEEVAYEHWHRMLFARFLAENNLLMYPDPQESVAISLAECEDMAADEGARNGWELAARYAAKMLPQIFRPDSPVFGVALPPEIQQSLESFISDLPVTVFTASDSLGWVYQFWQSRRKDQVNASEVKIGARELPAVTQLFTEDYMVDFLLDNTLGAWYAGKILAANSKLAEKAKTEEELRNAVALPGCLWAYLRFIKSEDGKWSPAAGTFEGWPKAAKDLKCLDPCMGSGHFVVAMFERLVGLRTAEESLDESEAVASVISDNLFGLEIDPRCTQIAAFNLALAAWRRVGYCLLPPMNLACSGLAPNTSEEEWLKLADGNEKLENGIASLYELFENAPVLGSLINPHAGQADLLEAGFSELRPLLELALAQDSDDHAAHELAVTARGLAKAAGILACQFTLVATNVPYLGRGSQADVLMEYCERVHVESKNELATCFVERCLGFAGKGCSTALVTPQNWLFTDAGKGLRTELLRNFEWNVVARLGEGGFESSQAAGAFAACLVHSNRMAQENHSFSGIDASHLRSLSEKDSFLVASQIAVLHQSMQLRNPDARIAMEQIDTDLELLSTRVETAEGLSTGDGDRHLFTFWELIWPNQDWEAFQQGPAVTCFYGGLNLALRWENGRGDLCSSSGARIQGTLGWGEKGVLVSEMRNLWCCLHVGAKHDKTTGVIIPRDPTDLVAIWAYCESESYKKEVRKVDQLLKVAPRSLGKVPFDQAHWQKVAAEKYPDGLPKPFSSDPTQWLFNGHPKHSDNPLQVAVARLCGYEWPRQTGSSFPDCPALDPDGLESPADKDGIVCIPPVRGEASAADRLLDLLAKAYGQSWSSDVLPGLLKDAGYTGKSLETWLRDGFFLEHCELFYQRPFIWHIWDGLRDGFSALINYHKLDRKNLETLIYTYLGDWMMRQTQDLANGVDGAQEKLSAAEQLKKRLELILTGEAPYDIFVRWKPLHQQPIGWEPDLNDGVRMNIRPFMSVPDIKKKGAGVLREKPKIKWEKDRGKEPQRSKEEYPWFWGWDEKTADFTGGPECKGERFNDCHYSLAFKRNARATHVTGEGAKK